jgi:hypothetical protein
MNKICAVVLTVLVITLLLYVPICLVALIFNLPILESLLFMNNFFMAAIIVIFAIIGIVAVFNWYRDQ